MWYVFLNFTVITSPNFLTVSTYFFAKTEVFHYSVFTLMKKFAGRSKGFKSKSLQKVTVYPI